MRSHFKEWLDAKTQQLAHINNGIIQSETHSVQMTLFYMSLGLASGSVYVGPKCQLFNISDKIAINFRSVFARIFESVHCSNYVHSI